MNQESRIMNHGKQKTIINSIIHASCFMILSNRKGFTLIELLIVVAVLGIVSGGILIALNIGGVIGKASLTKAKTFSSQLERGLILSQVGKWSFEGNVNDTSGYGNIGSLNSAVIETSGNCTLGLGQCLKVSGGASEYVSVPDSPSLRIGAYTVSVWINHNGAPTETWKGIVGKGGGGSSVGRNYHIWLHETGYIHHRFAIPTDPNTGPNTPAGVIKWNQWNHVVITNDGTTAKTYVNGKVEASGSTGGQLVINNEPLCIGRNPDDNCAGVTERYFDGLIDEVQIYNEALTLSQIQSIYARGVLRKEISLRF